MCVGLNSKKKSKKKKFLIQIAIEQSTVTIAAAAVVVVVWLNEVFLFIAGYISSLLRFVCDLKLKKSSSSSFEEKKTHTPKTDNRNRKTP